MKYCDETLYRNGRSLFFGGASRRVYTAMALVLLGILTPMMSVHAQGGRSGDMVLYPTRTYLPLLIGVEGGYGWWTNEGNGFSISDGDRSCVTFNQGKGEGRVYGLKAMVYVTPWLFFSPRVRNEIRSGSATTPLASEPVRNLNNQIVMLEQEARADMEITATAIDATIGVEFFGFYLFGGGSMSLLNDGRYNYSERLISPTGITYAGTHSAEQMLIDGQPFDGYESSTYDLRFGGGYLLRFGSFAVNAEVFYSSPLTSVLAAPSELKQTGVIATFGLMYNLGD